MKLVENDGNYLEKPAWVNPISQLFPNRKSQPGENNDVEDMNGTQGGYKEGNTLQLTHWSRDKMVHIIDKYSLLIRGTTFESFAKFIFERKTSIYVWICLLYMYRIQVPKRPAHSRIYYIMTKVYWSHKLDSFSALYVWSKLIHMQIRVWIMILIMKLWISLYQ